MKDTYDRLIEKIVPSQHDRYPLKIPL